MPHVADEGKGLYVTSPVTNEPRWITVDELRERLRISKTKAYQLATDGSLETIRIGRSLRVSEESYLRWCQSQRCPRP